MIGALVRKDYLVLVRNKFLTGIVGLLFILVIISFTMGNVGLGIAGYFMFVLGGIWQLLLTINNVEKSGGFILLISSPYSINKVVSSRYVSSLCLYAILTLLYLLISFATSFFTDLFPILTPQTILLSFFVTSLFIAVTVPLYLKFSEFTVRIISLCIILGGYFAVYFFRNMITTALSALQLTPQAIFASAVFIGIAALLLSRSIAIYIAKKMEY